MSPVHYNYRLVPSGMAVDGKDVTFVMVACPQNQAHTGDDLNLSSILSFIAQVETWTLNAQMAYQAEMFRAADWDVDSLHDKFYSLSRPPSLTYYAIPMAKGKTLLVTRYSHMNSPVRLSLAEVMQTPTGEFIRELSSYARQTLNNHGLRYNSNYSNESENSWAELTNYNLDPHITAELLKREVDEELVHIAHGQFVSCVQRFMQRGEVGGMVPTDTILAEKVAGFKSSDLTELHSDTLLPGMWAEQFKTMFSKTFDFRYLSIPHLTDFKTYHLGDLLTWDQMQCITKQEFIDMTIPGSDSSLNSEE